MKKYTNVSGEVIYTITISVDVDGEFESLDEVENAILEQADYEWHRPYALTPDEVRVISQNHTEEEVEEESEET